MIKKIHPYPFMSAKNLDAMIDAIHDEYKRDIDFAGIVFDSIVNVSGQVPDIASGIAESIVKASSRYAETGKTILLVSFNGASKFISEIALDAAQTAFFVASYVAKPFEFPSIPTIKDVWDWFKTVNDINVFTPFFIPDNRENENPATILSIPETSINYDFSGVTDITVANIDRIFPNNRVYAGSIIDFYPLDAKAFITCIHTRTQESIRYHPDFYEFNESLWDLSDINHNPPYQSGFTSHNPLIIDNDSGVRVFWFDYSEKEDIWVKNIRVSKQWGKQAGDMEFSSGFCEWENTVYSPISAHVAGDRKVEVSEVFNPDLETLEYNSIERTFALIAHGIYISEGSYFTFKVKSRETTIFPIVPILPAVLLILKYIGVVPAILAVIAGVVGVIRTNIKQEGE